MNINLKCPISLLYVVIATLLGLGRFETCLGIEAKSGYLESNGSFYFSQDMDTTYIELKLKNYSKDTCFFDGNLLSTYLLPDSFWSQQISIPMNDHLAKKTVSLYKTKKSKCGFFDFSQTRRIRNSNGKQAIEDAYSLIQCIGGNYFYIQPGAEIKIIFVFNSEQVREWNGEITCIFDYTTDKNVVLGNANEPCNYKQCVVKVAVN